MSLGTIWGVFLVLLLFVLTERIIHYVRKC